jgi:hypothetical protein
MNKTVLIVSYFYPPHVSPGAIRASKYARYLPEYGWVPLILTADKNDYAGDLPIEVAPGALYRTHQFDINALPKLFINSNESPVHKNASNRKRIVSHILSVGRKSYADIANFPDGQIGWYPYAWRKGLRIVNERLPQVIFSTSSPATDHLVGYKLKQKTGLPWIAELRDPWTQNHNYQRVQPFRELEFCLEKRVLNAADAVITVSEPWAAELRKYVQAPVYVVHNGFDSKDYPRRLPLAHPLTISYTGILYEGHQDPSPLFEAIASLHKKDILKPTRLRLKFIGRFVNKLSAAADKFGISEYVEIRNATDRAEALRIQTESFLLLMLSWHGPHRFGCMGLKLYEYFGSGRPVLAIGPKDCGASVLTAQLNAGFIAENAQQVESILLNALTEFENTGDVSFSPDVEGLRRFERRNLTGELAAILDRVINKQKVLPSGAGRKD